MVILFVATACVFYYLIVWFAGLPSFPHDIATFDWIPIKSRIQLALMLDRWKAAVDRRKYIEICGRHIAPLIPGEQEKKKFFEQKLKEAYEDAAKRRKKSERSGILTPPDIDYEHWEKILEKNVHGAKSRRRACIIREWALLYGCETPI